jgi:hypothetical protein
MIKKIQVQLKKYSAKPVNRNNLDYFNKFANHANPMEVKKYKVKFSIISVLKFKR